LEFKIELLKRGLTNKQIAELLGVDPSMVSQIINGLGESARIREHLERLLRDMQSGKFERLEDY